MIAVIDYGMGNLRSVEKALQYIGCKAEISSDPDFVRQCKAIVLPGVGAFKDAMDSLARSGMDEVVKSCIYSGKPFLGICLGLQLLFEYSEECFEEKAGASGINGTSSTSGDSSISGGASSTSSASGASGYLCEAGQVKGLGILKGAVKRFGLDSGLKIPHMGWNRLYIKKPEMFEGLNTTNPYTYFVHSYYLQAENSGYTAASCRYGTEFDAAIQHENIFAVQFHPEKSSSAGLTVLRNWAAGFGGM